MKAPDKCYIIREKNGVVYSLSFNDNGGLEYIRKDALLEWANKELSTRRDSGDADFLPAIVVLDDLIDKLNSL